MKTGSKNPRIHYNLIRIRITIREKLKICIGMMIRQENELWFRINLVSFIHSFNISFSDFLLATTVERISCLTLDMGERRKIITFLISIELTVLRTLDNTSCVSSTRGSHELRLSSPSH